MNKSCVISLKFEIPHLTSFEQFLLVLIDFVISIRFTDCILFMTMVHFKNHSQLKICLCIIIIAYSIWHHIHPNLF